MEKSMTRFVLGSVVLALVLTFGAITAFAFDVACAYHPMALCYGTGQYKYIAGNAYQIYHCSCGDEVLVRQ